MMSQEQTDKSFLLIANFQVWVRDIASALKMPPEDIMGVIYQYLLDAAQNAKAQDPIPSMGAQSSLSKNSQVAP